MNPFKLFQPKDGSTPTRPQVLASFAVLWGIVIAVSFTLLLFQGFAAFMAARSARNAIERELAATATAQAQPFSSTSESFAQPETTPFPAYGNTSAEEAAPAGDGGNASVLVSLEPDTAPDGLWELARCTPDRNCTRLGAQPAALEDTWCLAAFYASGDGLLFLLARRSGTDWSLSIDEPFATMTRVGCEPLLQRGQEAAASLQPVAIISTEPTALPPTETLFPTPTAQAIPVAVGPIAANRIRASSENTAPSGRDSCQNTISYDTANVTDGDTATTWRVLGDGKGASLTLTFDAPVQITEMQVFAGYGKVDPCGNIDRWPQGYRASVIELRFSDGTTETHNLADVRELQPLPLEKPITAEWVKIIIVNTRPPAADGAPRPYAAISDVVVIGSQP